MQPNHSLAAGLAAIPESPFAADEPPRCYSWPFRPAAGLKPCSDSYYCPAQADGHQPGVTHGLIRRRHAAHRLAGHARRLVMGRHSCLSYVVHVRAALAAKEETRVHGFVRDQVAVIDPGASVWSFVHRGPALHGPDSWPHFHCLIWTRRPAAIQAEANGISTAVTRHGYRLRQPPRGPGRPRNTQFSPNTSPVGIQVRIDCQELREASGEGGLEGLVRYCLRARLDGRGVEDDRELVRPPTGEGYRLMYGTPPMSRQRAGGLGGRMRGGRVSNDCGGERGR